MSAPTTRILVLSFVVLLVLVAVVGMYLRSRIVGTLVLDAPAPRVVPDTLDAEPEHVASHIEVRVTYNLGGAVDSLEAAVPRTYGDVEHKLPFSKLKGASYAYALSRTPFHVAVSGQTLSLSADVEYQGRLWYRPPIGPELSAGCGTGDEPRPRVRATLACTAQLTPSWQVRTSTRVVRLEPFSDDDRDRCRLTPLRIDVTEPIVSETRRMLDEHLASFDRSVERWPVRERFAEAWTQLQQRIPLGSGVYLEVDPYAAQLGPIGAEGETVVAHLRMIASPRIVTDAELARPRPLPPLETTREAGRGAQVAVEARFTYPVANALLRTALVGRTLEQDGHKVEITDVRLAGIGGGRVSLGVTLAGRARGRLYFTGTPSLDPIRHEVGVPDLDFDVGTAQALVRGLAWLKGVDLRDFLRARARLPASQALGMLRELAESGINRTLAPGVTLSGRIHDARVTGVRASSQEIRVRAAADAEFTLAIDRAPELPRLTP